jgi:tRNA nucleotidyltransferase (CCA-adding enzyme)
MTINNLAMKIPKEIKSIINELKKKGYQAYIVGGCLRDGLRGVEPKDWDVATNAKPEEITKVFPKCYSDNKFGTVTVPTKSKKKNLKEVEITPYRIDEEYSDKRHPDKIKWAETIEEDLSRRDFTVNAMAMDIGTVLSMEASPLGQFYGKSAGGTYPAEKTITKIIDPFQGEKDLKNKIIRSVGNPGKRFQEDALRLMRAVRFAITLEERGVWFIEEKTREAIKENSSALAEISQERIREELMKIIMSRDGARGIELLRRLNLLKYIIPELEEGFGVGQNKHHIYQVYQHNLLSLNYACQKNYSKHVRLAALLHDVAKPMTKEGEGLDSTFYNHEVLGAKITKKILRRLRFPNKDIERVAILVRYHLFYYNVDEVGESSVRKLIRQVGRDNMAELIQLRTCDRIGSGVPKAKPYKLRHLEYLIDKVSQDPISVEKLDINGNEIMKILKIKPGPKIGEILDILLSEVLDEPKNNAGKKLKERVNKLFLLKEKKYQAILKEARKKIKEVKFKRDKMTRQKYWIS